MSRRASPASACRAPRRSRRRAANTVRRCASRSSSSATGFWSCAVVVVPLGIGVVIGVFGLRRFGGSLSRRRLAEGGLLVLGIVTTTLAAAGWLDGVLRALGLGF